MKIITKKCRKNNKTPKKYEISLSLRPKCIFIWLNIVLEENTPLYYINFQTTKEKYNIINK